MRLVVHQLVVHIGCVAGSISVGFANVSSSLRLALGVQQCRAKPGRQVARATPCLSTLGEQHSECILVLPQPIEGEVVATYACFARDGVGQCFVYSSFCLPSSTLRRCSAA